MDLSSKDYDRIRVAGRARRGRGAPGAAAGGGAGKARAADTAVMDRVCEWEGCQAAAEYKAPKGRDHEGEYHWFCLDHVREYNKNYNYFAGMNDDDVIAYQRDAVTGHRPTAPIGVRGAERARARSAKGAAFEDPFGFFGGAERQDAPEKERRKTNGPERRAFEIMGLEETASKDAIKARYKSLVKRHHPDANQGDRSSEERLRSVINAYAVLRRAGYC